MIQALQPRAPAGRARAAAEHMGPRAGRTPGGRDPEDQRGAASEDGPRHTRGAPWVDFHAERLLAALVTCGDTVGSTFQNRRNLEALATSHLPGVKPSLATLATAELFLSGTVLILSLAVSLWASSVCVPQREPMWCVAPTEPGRRPRGSPGSEDSSQKGNLIEWHLNISSSTPS